MSSEKELFKAQELKKEIEHYRTTLLGVCDILTNLSTQMLNIVANVKSDLNSRAKTEK